MKKWNFFAVGFVTMFGLLWGAAHPLVFAKEDHMDFVIQSTEFAHGEEIPARHSCEGEDVSPALIWSGVPDQAKSLVLIVDDPDAPDPAAPKMTWVHWVIYNISPSLKGIPGGMTLGDRFIGSSDGLNDWNQVGYGGPCPPVGRHRYFFKLYALDVMLAKMDDPQKSDVERAMKGHVIAEAILMGTYQKSR